MWRITDRLINSTRISKFKLVVTDNDWRSISKQRVKWELTGYSGNPNSYVRELYHKFLEAHATDKWLIMDYLDVDQSVKDWIIRESSKIKDDQRQSILSLIVYPLLKRNPPMLTMIPTYRRDPRGEVKFLMMVESYLNLVLVH